MGYLKCSFNSADRYHLFFDKYVTNSDIKINVTPPDSVKVVPIVKEGSAYHFNVVSAGTVEITGFNIDANADDDITAFSLARSEHGADPEASWNLEGYVPQGFEAIPSLPEFAFEQPPDQDSIADETISVDIPKGFNPTHKYASIDGYSFKFEYLQGPSYPNSDGAVDKYFLDQANHGPLNCLATDDGPYWWDGGAKGGSALFGCVNLDNQSVWWSHLYIKGDGYRVRERGGLLYDLHSYETFAHRLSPAGTLVPLAFQVWWRNLKVTNGPKTLSSTALISSLS